MAFVRYFFLKLPWYKQRQFNLEWISFSFPTSCCTIRNKSQSFVFLSVFSAFCFCVREVSEDYKRRKEDEGKRQHLNSIWGIEWGLVQTNQWPSGLVFVKDWTALFTALCIALIKKPQLEHNDLKSISQALQFLIKIVFSHHQMLHLNKWKKIAEFYFKCLLKVLVFFHSAAFLFCERGAPCPQWCHVCTLPSCFQTVNDKMYPSEDWSSISIAAHGEWFREM